MRATNLAEETEDFTGNIWRLENSETVLIDTGTGDSWNQLKQLEKVDKIVVTHSHYDHVDNLPEVVGKYEPEVYAYEPENLSVEAEKLEEDDNVDLCGNNFTVIHTPGHKDDSICLFNESEGILFTGDLIFPDSGFGRTDLEEGDRDVLIESIEKIVTLDVEEFYPGHGEAVRENANDQIQSSLEEAKKHESKY